MDLSSILETFIWVNLCHGVMHWYFFWLLILHRSFISLFVSHISQAEDKATLIDRKSVV